MGSNFQNLQLTNASASGITLSDSVFVLGQLSQTAASAKITSSNKALLISGANASTVTFSNTRVVLVGAGTVTAFNNMVFSGMTSTSIQLDITRTSGTFTFSGHTYSTAPTLSGKYIRIAAGTLSLTMGGVTNPIGSFGLPGSTVGAGATLIWP